MSSDSNNIISCTLVILFYCEAISDSLTLAIQYHYISYWGLQLEHIVYYKCNLNFILTACTHVIYNIVTMVIIVISLSYSVYNTNISHWLPWRGRRHTLYTHKHRVLTG